MTRTSLFVFVSLTLMSCTVSKANKEKQSEDKNSFSVTRLPNSIHHNHPTVPEALGWDADIYLVNFSTEQEAKVAKAVEIIKKVVALREFRDRVYNYTYKGKRQFFDNGGFTNEQVYQKILEGAEQMGNKAKNNVMDVELELYTQATNTIGYTYPNTVRIWMNKKYFNKYTPINVADNLMHEWMHKLGFVHATTWSESRDHSIPYAIGYLVEELARKYFH